MSHDNDDKSSRPSQPENKRSSRDMMMSTYDDDDDIVGLDVGGRMYYTHRSTLTTMNAKGSALATRIDSNTMIPAGSEYKDDKGRTVYFIDRNGDVFQYILDYLRNDCINIPSFAKRPELWRDIRQEAEFYGIDGLLDRLYVTHTIKRNEQARGIFYWLGTKKGTVPGVEYVNPYDQGEIRIFDWLDPTRVDDSFIGDQYHTSPSALVQYRAPVLGPSIETLGDPSSGWGRFRPSICEARTKCSFFGRNFSIVVDLCSILVRPVAYSLRHAGRIQCCQNWNLEASFEEDGEWDVLHAARSDTNLKDSVTVQMHDLCTTMNGLRDRMAEKQALELPLLYAERHLRHTWDIQGAAADKFYRFFRLSSVSGLNHTDFGLDAVGFELFGDIHEM